MSSHHTSSTTTDTIIPDGNNGVLSRLSKTSWVWVTLLGFGSAGIGGYYAVKQDLTVQGATLQLQISDLKAQMEELKKASAEVVPRQEHQVRLDMQREIDSWKDRYYQSKIEELEHAIRK